MGVDLVVVNYRTPSDLEGFLLSYAELQDEVSATLHIVNVDPTVADLEVTNLWSTSLVTCGNVTDFDTNVGYSAACNRSSALGTNDVIGFFNADTRLKPGVLAGVLEEFDRNPRAAVVGPKQVDEQGRLMHAGIFGTNDHPAIRAWMEQDHHQYDEIRTDVVTVQGSAYFVRRSVWDELKACPSFRQVAPTAEGAFLPTPHYYEETWCSYHAREHGYECVYLGTVSMIHRWHQSSPLGGWADQQMAVSREIFRAACDAHGIARD